MDYETRLKILYQTYDMFPDKSIRNLFLGSEELAIKNINELVYYTTGKRVDLSPALDFKGFLVKSKKDGEPIALKTEALGPYAGVPSYEVLVTVNGAFILHKYDADDTVYIPAESVITTLEENVNAGRKQNRWCSI